LSRPKVQKKRFAKEDGRRKKESRFLNSVMQSVFSYCTVELRVANWWLSRGKEVLSIEL